MDQKHKNVAKTHFILIIVGFLAVIGVLTLSASIGFKNINDINARLQEVVQQNNVKSLLMTRMRDVIRERMLIVYAVVNVRDPFEQDELQEKYSGFASQFVDARDKLAALRLTEEQVRQLDGQRKTLGEAQVILNQVFELVRGEQYEEASNQAIKAHEMNNRVLTELQEMRELQQKIAESSVTESGEATARARQKIIFLVSLAIGISAVIIGFVLFIIRRQDKALTQTMEELEDVNLNLEKRVVERTNELMSTKAENMRMSAELEVTHQLQHMLLPREEELLQVKGLDIAGFMEPADEVGGDYYDVLTYDGRTIIGIGDVTGHGLESSVIMLMAQMAVRTLAVSRELDPVKYLNILNRTIFDNVQRMGSHKNLTLALLEYDAGNLKLYGQHEEMIVVRKETGALERIDTIDLGFPIGLQDDISDFIHTHEIKLAPGDVAVLFTDGIPEAENFRKEYYQVERLCDVIKANFTRPVNEIRQAVIDDVRRHIGDHIVYDDITLVVLKQQ